MAKLEFQLEHGLPFGKGDEAELQYDVELRELDTGDVLDAQLDSERLVETSQGSEFVSSPTLMGVHLLRRQIKRVGKTQGPLSLADMRRLHPDDTELLNRKTAALDQASLKEAQTRGRVAAAADSAGASQPGAVDKTE